MPMPCAIATVGDESETFAPLTMISPSVGCSSPKSIFISVLLPAPFSPISACISPRRTEKSTDWFAAIPFGYTFVIPFICTTRSF